MNGELPANVIKERKESSLQNLDKTFPSMEPEYKKLGMMEDSQAFRKQYWKSITP